nr:unnamed protein product [Callosobruchus chinensis]
MNKTVMPFQMLSVYHRIYDASLALIAFSVYTNTLKLFDTNGKSELSCISGIKFFSMIWIVLGHVFVGYFMAPFSNFLDIIEYEQTTRAMFQHATTFAVDTFLCLAGLLVVYNFMQSINSGRRFNIPLFYVHRYLRLTPALGALVLVSVYLLDYMGSGPKWVLTKEMFQKQCERYWWSSFLYIQNYANEQPHVCLDHTWYLSVDTQLYFLSPIFLILLWKYPKAGIALLVSATLGSMVSVAYVTYQYRLPAMSSYLIGALGGYILYFMKSRKYKIDKMLLLPLWTVMLAVMLGCIFAGHDTLMGPEYRKWDHVLYMTLVRPSWSVFIAWMVVACVLGHGGIINSFLSNKIFQVLSRFSYSVYLIHFVEICLWEFSRKTGVYFTEADLMFDFWGHFMFTLGISYVWILAFESPVIVLEKAHGLTGYPIALCLPNQCSSKEINDRFKIFPHFHFHCQTKETRYPPLTKGAIATICFLCIVGLMMFLSTAYDVYYRQNNKDLSCISGIKSLSMIWIIFGHVLMGYVMSPISNFLEVVEYARTTRAMFQNGATFAVDTFLCLAGLLLVYNFLQIIHSGRKFNLLHFYVHRYLRLTPAVGALILVTANLLDKIGSGPRWGMFREMFQKQCKDYWWSSLLYIQNYTKGPLNLLYFMSPIFLVLLWRYPRAGIALLASATFGSMVTVAYLTYHYELPALLTSPLIWFKFNDFLEKYYFGTHTRMSSYLIGALGGYILYVMKSKKYKISKVLPLILWSVMLAVMLGCLFAGNRSLRGLEYKKWDNILYMTFVRPSWSVFITWMVVACALGHGGIINSFLSNKIFRVLSRFSYSVYLIHFVEIFLWAFSRKTGVYFSEVGTLFDFWGHFMFSLGISYVWILAFESPVIVLEKVLIGRIVQ